MLEPLGAFNVGARLPGSRHIVSPVVLEEEVKIVKSEATDVMGLSIPDDMIALMQNVAYMRQIKSMSIKVWPLLSVDVSSGVVSWWWQSQHCVSLSLSCIHT